MFLKINDVSIAYDDVGEGQEVVLIHGFPLSRSMWGPQVGSLVASGYRVITFDLPGFGESEDMPVQGISDYSDLLEALLTQLKIRRAVIGGMSMGGYVLLNFIARYPERVEAALFIVTRADADDEAAQKKREAMIEFVQTGQRQRVIEAFRSVLFGPDVNPDLVKLVESWMVEASDQALVQGLASMKSRLDRVHTLQGITMPSWVVTAEQDRAIPPTFSKTLENQIPNCRLEIIEHAGHMVNREQSTEFNRRMLTFLNELFSF